MTQEQFLPTRWILYGVSRKQLSEHLLSLRRVGRELAAKCLYQIHWVGVYPLPARRPVRGERRTAKGAAHV